MSNTEIKEEIDLLSIIGIIIKNIKVIIIITGIFMIGITVVVLIGAKLSPEESFLPDKFSPKTIVMLNSNNSSSMDSLLNSSGMGAVASLAGFTSGNSISDADLAIKISSTFSFIDKLSKEFNLMELYDLQDSDTPETDLKRTFAKKLLIKHDDKTNMLSITYTDINKYLATELVNRATDILEEEFALIDKKRNKRQSIILEEKENKVYNELKKIQNDLVAFQTKYNMVDVNTLYNELMSQISQLQVELLQKEVDLESYGKFSNVQDPGYIILETEISALRRAIEKIKNGDIGEYPPIEELPLLAIKMEEIKRNLEMQSTLYKHIIQQVETLKLTEDGTAATFQVLEKARIPEQKSSPSRARLCIIFSIVGFFISMVYIFIKEIWINIKNDPEKMLKIRGNK